MNDYINAYLRCFLALAYVALFLVAPPAILWGFWGGIAGLFVTLSFLFALRVNAEKHILKKLHAVPLTKVEHPSVYGIAEEHARRFGLPSPNICLIPHSSANIATFRFSDGKSHLILTKGLLDQLERKALSSVMARAIADLWHPQSFCHAWLSRLLFIFDRQDFKASEVSFASRRFHSFQQFILQLIVYPLHVVPIYLLTRKGLATQLDDISTRISHLPRELSESLRFLASQRLLNPLNVPLSVTHLFLIPPPPRHAIAQLLLETPSLLPRIQILESRQKILVMS